MKDALWSEARLAHPIHPPLPAFGQRRVDILLPRELPPAASARRKIWELGATLHCSVIGTCITTAELRVALRKSGALFEEGLSEHDLHTVAVSAAGKHDGAARQIHKALDRRHRLALNQAGKAKTAEALRQYWQDSVQRGEIPGAYWAVLTHPAADDALVCHAFGDVHMLSHLMGAANRADIRRLRQLEEEKALLEEKLARQQAQLRDGIVARDRKIAELSAALSVRIETEAAALPPAGESASEQATLRGLVADLRRQLDREIRRRERAEMAATARGKDERARQQAESEAAALRAELDSVEARLGAMLARGDEPGDLDLAGLTLLYVGGQPHQAARLRALVEDAAGIFIHHDGGIEERSELLPGLVSRADVAFFPVDCISHRAALLLKRLCQQAGKPFVPLRSAGVASMMRALKSREAEFLPTPIRAAE